MDTAYGTVRGRFAAAFFVVPAAKEPREVFPAALVATGVRFDTFMSVYVTNPRLPALKYCRTYLTRVGPIRNDRLLPSLGQLTNRNLHFVCSPHMLRETFPLQLHPTNVTVCAVLVSDLTMMLALMHVTGLRTAEGFATAFESTGEGS